MSYAQNYGAAPPSDHGYGSEYGYGAPSSYGAPSYAPPASAAPSYGGPPSYGAPAYSGPPGYGAPNFPGNPDEPRTMFLSGFPADVKERELTNLCRFLPGYQASQMHWKNGAAQGFALFATAGAARAACDALRQLCFDEDSVLRADMARRNMNLRTDNVVTAQGLKRLRTDGPPGDRKPFCPGGEYPDNPPCNTLFVGNLGQGTNEQEMIEVFSKGPGFRQLKLAQGTKNMTAFIEYDDVVSAEAMHKVNQGITLRSNERGPLQVQFSKAPFRRNRENNMDSTSNPAANPSARYAPGHYNPLAPKGMY